jgi:hypothetical protein
MTSKRPSNYNGSIRMSDADIEELARKHPRKAALLRACKAVGGAVQLAKLLPGTSDRRTRGVSHQIIYHWLQAGGVPESRVDDVAAVTGVSTAQLRGERVRG